MSSEEITLTNVEVFDTHVTLSWEGKSSQAILKNSIAERVWWLAALLEPGDLVKIDRTDPPNREIKDLHLLQRLRTNDE